MSGSGVILDDATIGRLTAATNGGPVPLLNAVGELVGYHLTPDQMARATLDREVVVSWLEKAWPPEVIARVVARAAADTGPKHSMDEVFRLVEET